MEDENLAVAIGPRADANCRDGQIRGEGGSGFAGNAFEHNCARTGTGQGVGIGLEL